MSHTAFDPASVFIADGLFDPAVLIDPPTGFPSLDKCCSLPRGALTLIAARPGHGRSAFQLNLALRLCTRSPESCVIYLSAEAPRERLALRAASIFADEPLGEEDPRPHQLKLAAAYADPKGATEQSMRAREMVDTLIRDSRLGLVPFAPGGDLEALADGLIALTGPRPIAALVVDSLTSFDDPIAAAVMLRRVALLSGRAVIAGFRINNPDVKTKKDLGFTSSSSLAIAGEHAGLVLGLWNEARHKEEDGRRPFTSNKTDLEVVVLKNRDGQPFAEASLRLHRPTLAIADPLDPPPAPIQPKRVPFHRAVAVPTP